MRYVFALAAVWIPAVASGATVIIDTHVSFGPGFFPPDGNHAARVNQDATGDYTSTWFNFSVVNGGNYELRVVGSNTDEGSDWYLVDAGDALTQKAIQEGKFSPLKAGDGSQPTVRVAPDFYLGIHTGNKGLTARESIGWVHLRAVRNSLTMVSNVMSYDSPGIIVGTTTVVPEPSTVGLYFAGVAGVAALRRWQINAAPARAAVEPN